MSVEEINEAFSDIVINGNVPYEKFQLLVSTIKVNNKQIEQLQQENKELKETIKADEKANLILANDNKELRKIRDKAIEYIKLFGNDFKYDDKSNLLEILEGDK